MDTKVNFHHIGVACKDINTTAIMYELLGYERGEIIHDPLQNVNICFLSHPTMPLVELLSPIDDTSPVVQTLNKVGTSPYHTCYVVNNLDEAINKFREQRYIVVAKPKKACAIENRRVSFLYNPNMGLIELVEN